MAIKSNSRQRQSTLKKDLLQLALLLLEDETGLSSDTTYLYLANQTDEVVRRIGFQEFVDEVRLLSSASVSTTSALTTDYDVVKCSGTITVTLPAVSGNTGFNFYIKNVGTGLVTIDGSGSETIDGSTSITLIASESRHLFCDGTEWWII